MDYVLIHDGHCDTASGLIDPGTLQGSPRSCRDKCALRGGAGYFSWSAPAHCECYLADGDCPQSNDRPNFQSYEILNSSCPGTAKVCECDDHLFF